jgi:hypothetical protein
MEDDFNRLLYNGELLPFRDKYFEQGNALVLFRNVLDDINENNYDLFVEDLHLIKEKYLDIFPNLLYFLEEWNSQFISNIDKLRFINNFKNAIEFNY